MIRIYCNENDEPHFENCLCYDTTNKTCKLYNDDCSECPYAEENIQFVHHDIDNIIIKTDEIDLDIKTCIYNTPYNYHGCGMIDLSKNEDCEQCRFFYDNIEIKEETK